MNKKLRIVFMGTPEFAAYHLKKMVENNYHIVAVITAPDKPAGRGKKLKQSAVKQYALSVGIPVLQPKNLKSDSFLDTLKKYQPDVQVVVAFRMLPRQVWQLPPLGTFNLHASLLPDYRGAAPINWAIINGEKITGVTTFFIDNKIDTGEIILQEKENILPQDNASSLHDRLIKKGSDLVMKTIDLIAQNKVNTIPQPQKNLPKKAPKLNRENTYINWNKKTVEVHNFIRGLAMYPGAWTNIITDETNKTLKFIIYKSEYEIIKHNEKPGQITNTKKTMRIAVKDGFIFPKIVKLQGKKQMDIVSFLNGIRNKDMLRICKKKE